MTLNHLEKIFYTYSHLEKASDYQYFEDVESCVYFWYYPINFKQKGQTINHIVKDFFENSLPIYNQINSLELKDNNKKMYVTTGAFEPYTPPEIKTNNEDQLFFNRFNEIFNYFSTLNKPIYIGKSTRLESSIKKRIKEHIELKTDFSRTLDIKLKSINANIEIDDLLVRVLDVEKLRKERFNNYIDKDFDFAFFLEKLLITLYKPFYNIKQ
ncbi:hypothetical protein [Mangrovimonas sp. TPBH4]|uniref:hypothetical protein n=1 Tax=Mangrovimonas sp. TPBH4 TaxID=1645914 RepID=UPI0006B61581|nr:hypothetical protein [Mangrovimonas sp. TPBH4]